MEGEGGEEGGACELSDYSAAPTCAVIEWRSLLDESGEAVDGNGDGNNDGDDNGKVISMSQAPRSSKKNMNMKMKLKEEATDTNDGADNGANNTAGGVGGASGKDSNYMPEKLAAFDQANREAEAIRQLGQGKGTH